MARLRLNLTFPKTKISYKSIMRCSILLIVTVLCVVACKQKQEQLPAGAVPPKFTADEMSKSLTLLAREGQKGKERFAELDRVRGSAPYLSDFLGLFPQSEVNYIYFTSTDGPGFDVAVDLYERYEFEMRLPVQWDSERRAVVGYGEPMYSIREVTNATRGPSGVAENTLNPAGERHFGPTGWRTLASQNGDFRAIGYVLVTNRPVPGFRDRRSHP
jgi:hypothetical protein